MYQVEIRVIKNHWPGPTITIRNYIFKVVKDFPNLSSKVTLESDIVKKTRSGVCTM